LLNGILVVFVCNKLYYESFINTYNQLRNKGKYKGEVILIIGNDLEEDEIKIEGLKVKKFPEIEFSDNFKEIIKKVETDGRNLTKLFQWHKLNIFDDFFKQWEYVMYIDCGMKIENDIEPLINLRKVGKIVAHSDCFPKYKLLLDRQFDLKIEPYSKDLIKKYGILKEDFFQTGLMIYDTKILGETVKDLINLAEEFPISRTNEQAIVALYFVKIKNKWEKMPLGNRKIKYYDSCRRNNPYNLPFIMYKYK